MELARRTWFKAALQNIGSFGGPFRRNMSVSITVRTQCSLVIDVYSMGSSKEFVNTLKDQIRKRGAMDKLISDSARVETSDRVKDLLRAMMIDDWQSERGYQHQNPAERRYQNLVHNTMWVMNQRNVPGKAWFLCLEWTRDVMNRTAEESLGW